MVNTNKKQNISSYTPSLLDVETLESIFVKRQPLLDDLYDRHKSSILEKSKHFTLLIGPRGMGKTHLMSMLYHKFVNDKKVNSKAMIAWLREEEWGIASYLDLLTQIIKTLINQYELSTFNDRVEQLLSLTPQQAEYQAEKVLTDILKKKVLLLLTENLNLIFDSIEKHGQEKLRALIQNTGQITIIATSQSLFTGVSLRTCPFYGFFNITHLERLSFENAVELLINIAKYEGKQGLIDLLQTEKGRVRVRALHHLAGGSPRIYVIFSQFIQADSLDEFTDPMLKMLDELTPYYQAKMLELSAQQRKLITFLCRARGAVTVQEIARQNHITPQTASGQLKKLKVSGFVESQKSGKESYYEIAEPLMRLVFSVKENRGTPVTIIIELIRHWFSLNELKQFKDNDSIKLLGKQFINGDIIQQAMEVKEPSPHLSSTISEFKRYLSENDVTSAKKVLLDLHSFSEDLKDDLYSSVFNFMCSEQRLLKGKNVKKRIELVSKLLASTPNSYHSVLKLGCLHICILQNSIEGKDCVNFILSIFDKTNSHDVLTSAICISIYTKAVSSKIADKICKKLTLPNGPAFALAYSMIDKDDIEYIDQLMEVVEPIGFITAASRDDYTYDVILLSSLQKYQRLSGDSLIALAIQCVANNKIQTFNALIDTTLENIKNESISHSVRSLKAYSESKDKKHLMSLPKELRSLILNKQSERINDQPIE